MRAGMKIRVVVPMLAEFEVDKLPEGDDLPRKGSSTARALVSVVRRQLHDNFWTSHAMLGSVRMTGLAWEGGLPVKIKSPEGTKKG